MQVPLLVVSCVRKVISCAVTNAPFLFVRNSYKEILWCVWDLRTDPDFIWKKSLKTIADEKAKASWQSLVH